MATNNFIPTQFFDNVPDALAPLSANTEYKMCLPCSGETSSVNVPHPTYTNERGKAVVQLNAVALGGENGLNN
jgi:hypothetical protein